MNIRHMTRNQLIEAISKVTNEEMMKTMKNKTTKELIEEIESLINE